MAEVCRLTQELRLVRVSLFLLPPASLLPTVDSSSLADALSMISSASGEEKKFFMRNTLGLSDITSRVKVAPPLDWQG